MKMIYKNQKESMYNKKAEEWKAITGAADKLSKIVQNINKGEKVILQQDETGYYLAQVIKPNNTYQSGLPCDISDGSVISEYYL